MKRSKLVFAAMLAAGVISAGSTSTFAQVRKTPVTPPASSALAGPRQQVKDAQKLVDDARKEVTKIKEKVSKTFAGKDDVAKADQNLAKAKAAKEAASRALKKSLATREDYKKALQDQADADKAIADLDASNADDAKKEEIRQKRVELGIAVRKMETEAEKTDPAMAEAKEKFETARKERESFEDQIKEALDTDPEYDAAQKQLETAEAQLATAKQTLAQQSAAARQSSKANSTSVKPPKKGKY